MKKIFLFVFVLLFFFVLLQPVLADPKDADEKIGKPCYGVIEKLKGKKGIIDDYSTYWSTYTCQIGDSGYYQIAPGSGRLVWTDNHCADGVQDEGEEGIDCGGDCSPCPECKENEDCGPGGKCVSGQCENPDEDKDVDKKECTYDSDCPKGECIEGKCVSATLGLNVQLNMQEVLLKKGQELIITAIVSGPKNAAVSFHVSDPKGLFYSNGVSKSKSIDASGKAVLSLRFPSYNQMTKEKREQLPYEMPITVSAASHDQFVEKKAKITLISPAPKITLVEIKPLPVRSYNAYLITVQIEDPDSSEFQYFFKTQGIDFVSELEDSSGGNKVKMLLVDSASKSASVNYFSEEIGFNANEILMAQEMEGTLKGVGKSALMTAGKAAEKKYSKKIAESKLFVLIQKRGGKYIPIIGTAKTLYGLWGNAKNSGEKLASLMESANWREAMYHGSDLTLEGIKATAGVVDLVFGEVPIIGQFADLSQDLVDSALSAGQSYLKKMASDERFKSSQEREITKRVIIKVRDEDKFLDSETLEFKMKFHWVAN